MIEEFRLDDGKLEERTLCLTACISNGYPIQRGTYEFCHDFVMNNKFEGYVLTDTNDLADKVNDFNGDYFALACARVKQVWEERRR